MNRFATATILSALLWAPGSAFGQANSPVTAPTPASPPTTAAAVAGVQPQDGVKSPGVATLLSVLITGGGQMYADKVGKGLTLLGISMGSLITGEVMALHNVDACVDFCDTNRELTPLYVGGGIALGTWVYSMVTASGDARDHNDALTRQHAALPLQPLVQVAANGRQNVGISVALGH